MGSPIQIRSILQYFVDLSLSPTMTSMAILADAATDAKEKAEVAILSSGEHYRKRILQRWKTPLEILVEFPSIQLTLARLLDVLPRMQPRFYSISSSPLELKDRLSITIGVAQQISPAGRLVEGVCSSFLASVDPHKDAVIAFVRDLSNRSTPFKLPSDHDVPVVMVGAGTGIAPYMGFLQQRRALIKSGSSLGTASLYFGCRNADYDDLYSEELHQHEKDGSLSHLHIAYSRKSSQKEYCQDLIERDGAELWNLISEQKARLYICGSASGLAQGVRRSLVRLVETHGKRTSREAESFVASLEESGMYVADVWG
jgi:NADPH-ferrihemoprotein reductase